MLHVVRGVNGSDGPIGEWDRGLRPGLRRARARPRTPATLSRRPRASTGSGSRGGEAWRPASRPAATTAPPLANMIAAAPSIPAARLATPAISPISGGYVMDPTTPAAVRTPATAAARCGNRAEATAMIIGYTGPSAKPATRKSAIRAGPHATPTAARMAIPPTIAQAVVKRTGSKRSANRLATSRPAAMPPQKRDRPRVATNIGWSSRKPTSQLETPASAAT